MIIEAIVTRATYIFEPLPKLRKETNKKVREA
jgi:hypothetical protein